MKNKKDLLKAKKAKLAILTLCGTLALTGCGGSKDNNNGYYVIQYNMDNAVIYELGNYYLNDYSLNDSAFAISSIGIGGPYVLIKNENENSKEFAFNVASSLVGEDGNITFFDADNQLKLSK